MKEKKREKLKIGNTIVIPVSAKIIFVFTILLLLSNFLTNFINMNFMNIEITKMLKELLVKDLKEIYFFCNNQYEVFKFSKDTHKAIENIEKKALSQFLNSKSVLIGLKKDATLFLLATPIEGEIKFNGLNIIEYINRNGKSDSYEGVLQNFKFNKDNYFGIYKYNSKWDIYLIRGEEKVEFYKTYWFVFLKISLIIIIIVIFCVIFGILFLRHILRYLKFITSEIIKMINSQELKIIDLSKSTNDDISLLGIAFNSLSSTINNLMHIFLKFVNKDIADKAYKEKNVTLEGSEKELVMLFSDIKSFTYMTEQLGIDIIKLLNIHYKNAIRCILKYNGVIGSIIGDALLAVFGVLEHNNRSKAYDALLAAYDINSVTDNLRKEIEKKKIEIESSGRKLTKREESLYKALMIEVGIGIDGGNVFYGTIGSHERMTNTVIGDNVNSASRLEGLTRIYKVPIICSEYVKKEILNSYENIESVNKEEFIFVEIDTVLVKGKTIGTKIYWPIFKKDLNEELEKDISIFNKALALYYEGDWQNALKNFKKCNLSIASTFIERVKGQECPKGWNGIWTMKTK